MRGWQRKGSGLAGIVQEQTAICLNVYAKDPSRVLQDANNERRIAEGGYASRQLEELLQNAVDAARRGGERVEVLLTEDTLFVANDGEPFSEAGVRSVMASDLSAKDDDKIGKFGIGFKSVLAVSKSPTVYSRTVTFNFDALWAEEELRSAGYEFAHYPTMRLARVVDPDEAMADPRLRELMDWASTVIVLPLSIPVDVLSERLNEFPAEFVLFSPHIKKARLRNLAGADRKSKPGSPRKAADRTISQTHAGDGRVDLRSGDDTTRWVVTRAEHHPSDGARAEGGHVAARDTVEIQYALPIPPSSNRMGRFWAYFPTHFETTLTGLVNAPWKMSDDRTGLLEGHFNLELLETLPGLFTDAIDVLSGTVDAVSVIDAMPARGQEPRNWVDRDINEPIFRRLRTTPSLPDGDGVLKVPSQLRWVGDVPADWLAKWSTVSGAPVDRWLHPNAYSSPERRSKIVRLMRPDRVSSGKADNSAGIDEWLEALITDDGVLASAEAILLAAHILNEVDSTGSRSADILAGVRKAKIIRLETGEFRAPTKGRVFVRVPGEHNSDVEFVDPELAALPAVRDALDRLGVVVMDRSGELHRLLAHARTSSAIKDPGSVWSSIWGVIRDLPEDTAIRILSDDLGDPLEPKVHVRSASGSWLPIAQVYLAGRVVPEDGARDRDRLVDPRFHARDDSILRALGAVDAPAWRSQGPYEAWQFTYEEEMRDAFVQLQPAGGSRPDLAKVEIAPGTRGTVPPWPLAPLMSLEPESAAAVTAHIMTRPVPGNWRTRHTSNASYGTYAVPAPEVWLLRRYGRLPTVFGSLRPSKVLRAGEGIDPDVLPAVDVSDSWASALNLRTDPGDLAEGDWLELKETADSWRTAGDDDRRTAFYAWLPGRIECDKLVVRVGSQIQLVETQNIGVTEEQAVYDSMIEAQVPALLVTDHEDAGRFVELWNMPRGRDLLQEEIVVETAGEASYLTDLFPPLKLHLDPADQELMLQPARRIEKMIATPHGQVARRIDARRDGDAVIVTATDPETQLAQVSVALDLSLRPTDIARILQQMEQAAANKLRAAMRGASDDDHRLVTAVGEQALRRCVPAQALEILDRERGSASPEEVASLARAVHGVGILKQLRPALEERGLEPPREWAGRRVTRQWVASLGFPSDWAGFPGGSRAAVEVVDGPAVLSPLHNYQEFVTDRIKALLRGVGPDRGMVSLPTGAGKTRVTVEALVNAVREADLTSDAPMVWIAQTDELCEQAAETWSFVWRAAGARIPMRLGRLWANNEVPEEPARSN